MECASLIETLMLILKLSNFTKIGGAMPAYQNVVTKYKNHAVLRGIKQKNKKIKKQNKQTKKKTQTTGVYVVCFLLKGQSRWLVL